MHEQPGHRRDFPFLFITMSGRHFSAKTFRGEMLFYTRMIGMQKLAVLHAELKIGLSGSKCSPVLCLPIARAFPPRYPILLSR